MKIKSKDIAKALGVSTATVSLAINDRPGVNQQTKQEILDYIAQKQDDGSEIKKKNKTVAVIYFMGAEEDRTSSGNELFSKSYKEIYRQLSKADYNLNLIYFDPKKEDMKDVIDRCDTEEVAGIFLCAYDMDGKTLQLFEHCKVPVLVYDHDYFCDYGDNVLINNRQAVFAGLDYLHEKGHKDIVYFSNALPHYNFRKRREACKEYPEKPEIVIIGSSLTEAYEDIKAYMNQRAVLPTAVFAENYIIALGLLKYFIEQGLHVPKDISFIGIDELPESTLIDFKPTVLKVLHREKAKISTKRLIERMEGKARENIEVYVRCELMEGESVKRI